MNEKIRFIFDVILLICLVCAIIALFSAIFTIFKYKDMLQTEPITYLRERYRMTSCMCIDEEGAEWFSGDTGWIPHIRESIIRPNLTANLDF